MTFDLINDGPTLTGAAATFNINLNFPPNQTALSDGQVVWARNCTINGKMAANFDTENQLANEPNGKSNRRKKETIVVYVPGQQYEAGQAVYPDQNPDQSGVFPDGTPLNRGQKKKSRYVFVWKAWGK